MNILIFNWRDIKHPNSGGAEISLLEHAKYWRKQKAHITWFAAGYSGGKNEEIYDRIRVVRRGSQYTVHILAFFYYLFHFRKKTDIVIDNFHGLPFFTPLYVSRGKIIALINEPAKEVWFKNLFWPLSLFAFYLEPLFFLFYKKIPFITSASSILKELVDLGISEKNIWLIKHGITLENASKVKRDQFPTIIYLSQLSKDKGIEEALRAFSILKNKIKNAKLWVVGKAVNPSYEEFIKEKVKKENIENVSFLGYVSNEKKFALLKRSWVLVHPSIREGWGLNVIEANSCGTPAVGYNVTGLRDSIIHNKTGLLTKKNNSEELAKSIIEVVSDKKRYMQFSKNAVAWSRTFSWNDAGNKSWKLIKDAYEKTKS